jgi:hypothetical protein
VESIWDVKKAKETFRKAGTSFFFNEMSVRITAIEPPYIAPEVTMTVSTGEK